MWLRIGVCCISMNTAANLRVTQKRKNGFNKKICWSVRLCCWGNSSWRFESSALSLDCLTLMMEARQSAETSWNTRRQIRHIPARLNLKPPGDFLDLSLHDCNRPWDNWTEGPNLCTPLITVFIKQWAYFFQNKLDHLYATAIKWTPHEGEQHNINQLCNQTHAAKSLRT